MSPVFDKSALYRRWLHLPSIAVIALAGASVAIAHKGIDAWSARWSPKHERDPILTQLVGRSEIPHALPDHIEWSVTVSASAKNEDDAARALAAEAGKAIDKLLAAGVSRSELRVDEAMVLDANADENSTSGLYGNLDGKPRAPVAPRYEGTQSITIRSTKFVSSLGAYQAIATEPSASLDVAAPTCWIEDAGALRRQAQEAAWADLRRQTDLLRAGNVALGRVVSVEPSDVVISSHGETSSCDIDQSASATVSVTYQLR